MAITGNFLESVAYAGARKWGTGWNPVHNIREDGFPTKGKDVTTDTGPNAGTGGQIPAVLLNPQDEAPEYGYTDEDFSNMIWGYGPSTGTSDRPGMDVGTQDFRGNVTSNYPGMGNDPGPPGGADIRQISHGDFSGSVAKLGDKEETVGEGWLNKPVGGVINSTVSDPAQYEMQTSMAQRDLVRMGSQRGSGSASEYDAPIGSWRPTWGVRIKSWSTGRRLWDMTPRRQDDIPRPFWYRSAGTGYRDWLGANEAFNYQVSPLSRQPVPDPYAGQDIPNNVYQDESHNWVNAWY